MRRRPSRAIPAAVLALILSAVCVIVVLSLVQSLTGARELVAWAGIENRLRETVWTDGWVAGFGIAAVLVGIVLLGLAVLPGRPVVLPLVADDGIAAGVTRRGLRTALRAAAQSVEGVHSARVALRRRKVRVVVRTSRAHPAELADAVRAAVDERIGRIGPRSSPRISLRLRHTGSMR